MNQTSLCLVLFGVIHLLYSLDPRPRPDFIVYSTEKRGEPGIFCHVSVMQLTDGQKV